MNNGTTSQFIVLRELRGNDPTSFNQLQLLMLPHIQIITLLWAALWCTVAVIALSKVFKELRKK